MGKSDENEEASSYPLLAFDPPIHFSKHQLIHQQRKNSHHCYWQLEKQRYDPSSSPIEHERKTDQHEHENTDYDHYGILGY